MALLFDDDYTHLNEIGILYEEDEQNRFLILRNYPLPKGMYVASQAPVDSVDVLYVIPSNYNTAGGDMFWLRPQLSRADGKPIPQVSGPNQDSRIFGSEEFIRWSRHWNKLTWKPKEDNIVTILNRIEWALRNPNANK